MNKSILSLDQFSTKYLTLGAEDEPPMWGFVPDGPTWNGFVQPLLTLTQARTLVRLTQLWYSKDELPMEDVLVLTADNQLYLLNLAAHHISEVEPVYVEGLDEPVFPIGAESWGWMTLDDDSLSEAEAVELDAAIQQMQAEHRCDECMSTMVDMSDHALLCLCEFGTAARLRAVVRALGF